MSIKKKKLNSKVFKTTFLILIIGNLFTNKYSYKYNIDATITINTKSIDDRLILALIWSIIVLFGFEAIYFISKDLTKRITKPTQDSFDNQKDFISDDSHSIEYEYENMSTLIKSLFGLSKLEKEIWINNYKAENIFKIIERMSIIFEAVAFDKI